MRQTSEAQSETGVRPFSNGSEADYWRSGNCDRCQLNGYKNGGAVCPMEEAVSVGFIIGTVPAELVIEYGGTLSDAEDLGYCDMPRQCSRFVPPATCEYLKWPGTRRTEKCGEPATGEHLAHERRYAVCSRHAKQVAARVPEKNGGETT